MGGYFLKKKERFHNENSDAVHKCVCVAPHPGFLLPFSLFLKAELYLRDLNGGYYTLPLNQEEQLRKAWVTPQKRDVLTMRTSGYHRAVDTSYWSVIFLCSSYGDIA